MKLGCMVFGMVVGKHPLAYREPQGGFGPPGPPNLVRVGAWGGPQCGVKGHLRSLQKVQGGGCCDLQILEYWLLEER